MAAVRSARKLGYSRLKEHQLQVILSFVEGNDVFGVLPTGYGKSLCYAVLPDLLDTLLQPAEPSIVVIVTPLTAIMDDRVWLGNSGFELRNNIFCYR